MLDNDYRKPIEYAVKNKLDYKYETFIYFNIFDDQNNTLFHILVEENRMTALRLILEYAFNNGLLDTIGFGLKNKKNKTCFELAAEIKNSEAIYLLNHYELIDKSLKSNKNSSIIGPSFSIIKDNIEYFKELDKKSIYDPNIINNLIFEGGGVKGIGHVSALKESANKEIINLENIKRVGGTSAGAIIAVLLGVGYNLVELEEILNCFDFLQLLDSSADDKSDETRNKFFEIVAGLKKNVLGSQSFGPGFAKTFFNSAISIWQASNQNDFNIGFFSGVFFLDWIEGKIFEKLGIQHATFNDLQLLVNQKLNQNQNLKSIFLTGSNLTTGKIEIFSHLHTPNMIISDAVRISMSIPIIFQPHQFYIKSKEIINDQGVENVNYRRIVDPAKKYKLCEEVEVINNKMTKKVVKKDVLYVDGGLLNNYPINMFDSKRINEISESNYINSHTIGFRLVSKELKNEYESNYFKILNERKDVTNENNSKFLDLVKSLVGLYYTSEERFHSEKIKDQERTIYIDSKDVDGFDFNLKETDKQILKDSGKEAIKHYLNRLHNKKSNKIYLKLLHINN